MTANEIAKAAAEEWFDDFNLEHAAVQKAISDLAAVIAKHFAPLAEHRDRLLAGLDVLMSFCLPDDPGNPQCGYRIRVHHEYRDVLNELVAECEKEDKPCQP